MGVKGQRWISNLYFAKHHITLKTMKLVGKLIRYTHLFSAKFWLEIVDLKIIMLSQLRSHPSIHSVSIHPPRNHLFIHPVSIHSSDRHPSIYPAPIHSSFVSTNMHTFCSPFASTLCSSGNFDLRFAISLIYHPLVKCLSLHKDVQFFFDSAFGLG